MKIIARIDGSRVLVEMTEREVAHVVGYNYEGQLPHTRNQDEAFLSGTVYQVSPVWHRLQDQAVAAEKLEGVSKTLAALSDLVLQTKVQYTNVLAESPKMEGGAV